MTQIKIKKSFSNVIFNITSNDIVEKNKKNTTCSQKGAFTYYDKKRNISVNIFDKV